MNKFSIKLQEIREKNDDSQLVESNADNQNELNELEHNVDFNNMQNEIESQ